MAQRGRSVDFSVFGIVGQMARLSRFDTKIYGPTPFHRVLLAVGPEGGFADDEVARAVAAGWHTVDLGPRILRVETAALLLVAMVIEKGDWLRTNE